MARLSDVPRVLKHVGPFAFVRRVAHQVGEDNLLTWAAAMAYSWLFALFPFLIFLLSLLPLLPDRVRIWIVDQVDTSIETQLPGPAGDTVSQTLRPMLGVSDKPPTFKDFLTGQDDDGDEFTVEGRMIAEGDETITFFSDAFGRRTFDRANVTVTTKEQRLEEWNRTVGSRQVQSWTGLFSFGLLLTAFAASGGMNMTMSALDRCYDIKKPRPFWKQRLIAIGLTIVVGTLVIIVLTLIPVTSLLLTLLSGGFFSELLGGTPPWWVEPVINLVRYSLAVMLLVMILGIVYHFGPSLKRRFHLITPGAIFTIVAWVLTSLAMRTYIEGFGGSENYQNTYRGVGGIVILLLLFYVDALVLMIGAEINSEIDFAVLGIPRQDDEHPEEVAAAKIPEGELDDEERELRDELKEAVEGTPPPDEGEAKNS